MWGYICGATLQKILNIGVRVCVCVCCHCQRRITASSWTMLNAAATGYLIDIGSRCSGTTVTKPMLTGWFICRPLGGTWCLIRFDIHNDAGWLQGVWRERKATKYIKLLQQRDEWRTVRSWFHRPYRYTLKYGLHGANCVSKHTLGIASLRDVCTICILSRVKDA